jgi:hypothetical protein
MRKFDLNNSIDCAYLAGLFDGEGCITISWLPKRRKRHIDIKATIANTDEELIISLMSLGGSRFENFSVKARLTCYTWRLIGAACYPFIKSILPYSIVKREPLEIGLRMSERFCVNPCKGGGYGLGDSEFNLRFSIYKEFRAFRERQENDKIVVTYGSVIVPSQADVKQPLNESLLLAPQKK